MKTDEEIIADVIAREGQFVNDPLDSGGATMWGITQRTLADYRKKPVSIFDVEHLSVNEAKEIYRALYLVRSNIVTLNDPMLRALVLDTAVNHGVSGAIRMLQTALGVRPDGVLGPETQEAANNASAGKLWLQMMGQRLSAYGNLVTANPKNAKFAAGWMNRMRHLMEEFVV